MRCKACDVPLSNREATRKAVHSGDYPDLCDKCWGTISDECPVIDNPLHMIADDEETGEQTNED